MANDSDKVDACYALLEQQGKQLQLVSEPCRTVIIVDTAFGIIGNGGFQYFFEANFPDDPEYGMFAGAFHRVGLTEIARRFAELVAMFPFEAPHRSPDQRLRFLEACPADFAEAMEQLENLVFDCRDLHAILDDFLQQPSAR